MTQISHIHIPAGEFESRAETGKLSVIAQHLGDVGLEASQLLYAGGDGGMLLPIQQRRRVNAVSYKEFLERAAEKDETGSTNENGYPLFWAFRNRVVRPALFTLDRSQLVPKHPGDHVWQWFPRDGSSVEPAVRAVLFLPRS